MDARRTRSTLGLLLTVVLAGCTAVAPSGTPSSSGTPSPAPADASIVPEVSPVVTPDATPAGVLGGGRMLVWQLDGTDTTKVTTETIFSLDAGSGNIVPFGSLPVNEDNCCPTAIRLSVDGTKAVLISNQIRAIVDLPARTIGARPRGVPLWATVSSRSDRVAWIDDVTGTTESIVVTDLLGNELANLPLPTGSFFAQLSWSPDDRAFAVTTSIPIATGASGIRLASSIVACCTVDHGVSATHLLIVPVDGGPIRDVLDDAAAIRIDEAQPLPTQPPGATSGFGTKVVRGFSVIAWSPDGRTVLRSVSVCAAGWQTRTQRPPCIDTLSTVDIETGMTTRLPVPVPRIGAAAWSPDGRRLAFVGGAGDGPDGLYVMDADGTNLIEVGDADSGLLDWSPDGDWIAYWRLDPAVVDGNRTQVWVVPAAGGAPRFVVSHAAVAW